MNIFVLDYNPIRAAQMQCDKHIVKMPLESAQILCSAFTPGMAPYKRTHFNHPCTVWARASSENYQWLIEHGIALCDEYSYRYGKDHKSKAVIEWCSKNMKKILFPKRKKTRFALCFAEQYQIGNAVKSYREYYLSEKYSIAKWEKNRPPPKWFL